MGQVDPTIQQLAVPDTREESITRESGLELLQRELGGRKIAEFDAE